MQQMHVHLHACMAVCTRYVDVESMRSILTVWKSLCLALPIPAKSDAREHSRMQKKIGKSRGTIPV